MAERVELRQKTTKAALTASLGDVLEFNKPLAPLTSFETGGPARYYAAVQTADQLAKAVRSAGELNVPYYVIGGGSNLLVSDKGFDGLIIKVAIKGLAVEEKVKVHSGAGEGLLALVEFASRNYLTGLEFAAGIWGTVGGAIYGNAGAYGGEIKDVLVSLRLVDKSGKVKTVRCDYCRFGYRDSYLKVTGEVVIDAIFDLKPGKSEDIEARVEEILSWRRENHPVGSKTAGCFFKNIPDSSEEFGKLPAGRLLEEAGAKGLSVGGAVVFEKHANMIVNSGGATSKDIRRLADIMKKKVQEKFGVVLEEEVIQLGEF